MANKFKDLQRLLSMENVEDEESIERRFSDIADILLTKTSIRKKDRLYFLTDIEFYWFTASHKDIITYPRNCEAGEWYFHQSGVDISFKSFVSTKVVNGKRKPVLDGKERFGGILIRGIQPASNWLSDGEAKKFDGPYKSCDELFDKFNALQMPEDFPVLVEYEHSFDYKPAARLNLKGSKQTAEKVSGILNGNYYDASERLAEMITCFDKYFAKQYGYRKYKE